MINQLLSRRRLEVIVQLHEAAGQRRRRLPLRQWKQVTSLTSVPAAATPSLLRNSDSVKQAVAHPAKLRRPGGGGGQRPAAERRQGNQPGGCGRSGGGSERNCGAAGGEQLTDGGQLQKVTQLYD